MKNIQNIALKDGGNEEMLPGFSPDFPYIASCAELDKYADPVIPWHWHNTVELFYMQSGCLEYTTPGGKWIFPAGSGGMVNANVLHTTRIMQREEANIQLLHLFDPSFLSGEHGSRIESKYILPLTTSGLEIIPLHPENVDQESVLADICRAFEYTADEWGAEFKLRGSLTEIWLKLLELARPTMDGACRNSDGDDKIKEMICYIRDHFEEEIYIDQLAEAAHVSRRTCFRLFQQKLHMSPVEYIRAFRLRRACRMLAEGNESITRIAYACGLGPGSYFGRIFRLEYGCTPGEYRILAQK